MPRENGVNKIASKFKMIDVLARLHPQAFRTCTYFQSELFWNFSRPKLHAMPLSMSLCSNLSRLNANDIRIVFSTSNKQMFGNLKCSVCVIIIKYLNPFGWNVRRSRS